MTDTHTRTHIYILYVQQILISCCARYVLPVTVLRWWMFDVSQNDDSKVADFRANILESVHRGMRDRRCIAYENLSGETSMLHDRDRI